MSRNGPLIVHVVRQFLPNRGGLEDVVFNLCKAQLAEGYRVRVVTLDRLFTAPDRTLDARETISGIEVVRIPWRGSSRYPIAPSVFRHLGDAALVHVHAVDFFFDVLAWGWLLHRKPLVATTHGGFFHTAAFSGIKALWFSTVTRVSATAYRKLVCCSAADKATFDRIAASRTVLVENGTDTEKFASAAASAPTRGLITIGRFSSNKQLPRLLDAMSELTGAEPDWKLTIAGVPSDLSEADLRQAIAARRLDEHVHLAIGASNAEIREMMGNCSLFVSASNYEGFGLVAVEAMSAGLMPVLQPNEAYRALAASHDCITLADFDRPAAAADAIRQCFQKLQGNFADRRETAIASALDYAWPEVAGRYESVYRTILPGTPCTNGKAK